MSGIHSSGEAGCVWGALLPFVNLKSKALVFVIHHFISAEELNVAPHARVFVTLVFLLVLPADPDVPLEEQPSCDLLDVAGTAWCLSSVFWKL